MASLEGVDDAVKDIILVKNKEIIDAAKKLGQDIDIYVDKLHFRGHTDPWCNEHMDPYKVEALNDINTVKAEQTFAWLNKFTMVKCMNNERFELFFLFVFSTYAMVFAILHNNCLFLFLFQRFG